MTKPFHADIKSQLGEVAKRWKEHNYRPMRVGHISNVKSNGWMTAGSSNDPWDSEEIYDKLCSLSPDATLDEIVEILGKDDMLSAFHLIRCSNCDTIVEHAVIFSCYCDEYEDCGTAVCKTCLMEALVMCTNEEETTHNGGMEIVNADTERKQA